MLIFQVVPLFCKGYLVCCSFYSSLVLALPSIQFTFLAYMLLKSRWKQGELGFTRGQDKLEAYKKSMRRLQYIFISFYNLLLSMANICLSYAHRMPKKVTKISEIVSFEFCVHCHLQIFFPNMFYDKCQLCGFLVNKTLAYISWPIGNDQVCGSLGQYQQQVG